MGTFNTRTKLLGGLAVAGLTATLGCGQALARGDQQAGIAGEPGLASAEAQQGYSLGHAMGSQVVPVIEGVDTAAVVQGFSDAVHARTAALGAEEMLQAIHAFEAQRSEAQRAEMAALAAANAEAGEAFRAQFAQEPGVTALENGLLYKVIEPGAGDPPEKGASVTLHYRGSLVDGTEFDESYSRGEPITVPLDRALPGWTAALERMPEGAKWQVVIPPSLAYGEAGAGGFVEPNSTLIFEFERVSS